MKVEFKIGPEVKIKLSEKDLEYIKERILDEEKVILKLKEELFKIPEELRDYFNAEVCVTTNTIFDDRLCFVKVSIGTFTMGNIYIVSPQRTEGDHYEGEDIFLIGKVDLGRTKQMKKLKRILNKRNH